MGKISKKLILVYSSLLPTLFLGIFLINFILFRNTEQQRITVFIFFAISFVIFYALGVISLYLFSRGIDKKLTNYKNLSDPELKRLVQKVFKLPLFSVIHFTLFYIANISIIVYSGFYSGASFFTNISYFFVILAALLVIPSISLYFTGYLLRNISNELSKELQFRKLTIKSLRLSIRNKMLFAFLASIIGMTIFTLDVMYYYTAYKTADTKLEEFNHFQHYLKQTHPVFRKDSADFKQMAALATRLAKTLDATIIVMDKEGKKLFQTKKINFWNPVFKTKLKKDLIARKTGGFYENYFNNCIAFMPINHQYNLLFVTNIQHITTQLRDFFVWAFILIIIGFSISFTLVLLNNVWFYHSIKNLKILLTTIVASDKGNTLSSQANQKLSE